MNIFKIIFLSLSALIITQFYLLFPFLGLIIEPFLSNENN